MEAERIKQMAETLRAETMRGDQERLDVDVERQILMDMMYDRDRSMELLNG